MEIEDLPEGALQAAATITAALLQRPEYRDGEVQSDRFMASLYSASLLAVLAGSEDAVGHLSLRRAAQAKQP